ncbi:hypothetical protein [Aeromicrobium massiliense]|uniref:hypothetical protein n=1 Tax=Aeromicrobium massiliense TaxID=1464554 RepID=UPI0002E0D0B0|nr:hypothetical protein [Aeromicrobium massiliense]
MYEVGVDIKPGTYVSAGASSFNCYHAVRREAGSDLSSIITNGNAQGQTIVKVSKGQWLEVNGCEEFTRR